MRTRWTWTLGLMLASALATAPAQAQRTETRVESRDGRTYTRVCAGDSCDSTTSLDWANLERELSRLSAQVAEARAQEEQLVSQLRDQGSPADSQGMHMQIVLNYKLRNAIKQLFNAQMQLAMLCQGVPRSEGWIGVSFDTPRTMSRSNASGYWYTFTTTPRVTAVEERSPAERAGIHPGDSLVSIGGVDLVGHPLPLVLTPGQKIAVRLRRGSAPKTLTVVVGARPGAIQSSCAPGEMSLAPMRTAMPPMPAIASMPTMPPTDPDAPMAMLAVPAVPETPSIAPPAPVGAYGSTMAIAGAELTHMSEALRETFGARDGLLVLDVADRSPAQQAGLKAGDVIVSANGQKCTSVWALQSAIAHSGDQRNVSLVVVRRKAERTVALKW